MKYKTVSILYLSSHMAISIAQTNAWQERSKPNIIYILADDLGYSDIEPYGQQKIHTPHLNRMAEEGMLFTQHYAGCAVSAPSRGSLMTGMHTGHAQIRGNMEIEPEGQQPLDADTYTLGKMLQAEGYTTGIFGKWGLGYPGSTATPQTMGFDQFYGYNCQRKAHSFYPEYLWDNNQKDILEGNRNNGRAVYSQQLIQDRALTFIRENKDSPFFAMLTYTLPHAELNLPHDSIYNIYENRFEETPYNGWDGYYPTAKPRASFAAMVSTLDLYVGQVLDELQQLGIEDNTIVLFTSDNGPHREGGADPAFFNSAGNLRGTKRDLYEGGIRVPFIVRYPGVVPAGCKSDHVSAFWDVMPTLAQLSGVEMEHQTDGLSFLPTLTNGASQDKHGYLYWEFHEEGGKQAIRQENWKLVVLNVKQPEERIIELYDLSVDEREEKNVADDNKAIVSHLLTLIDEAHIESDLFPFTPQ